MFLCLFFVFFRILVLVLALVLVRVLVLARVLVPALHCVLVLIPVLVLVPVSFSSWAFVDGCRRTFTLASYWVFVA